MTGCGFIGDLLRTAASKLARRMHIALVFFLAIQSVPFAVLPNLLAQQPKPREYEVKATYLYNFARFVEWPPNNAPSKEEAFAICVLGQDPFGKTLDTAVAGEIVDGKNVIARRIAKAQDGMNCRILFVSSSEQKRLNETLATLDKTEVLTVSDMPDFSRRGGMIQFVFDGNRVRFEVNLTRTNGAHLKLSSELLKVAAAVRGNAQPGD